MSGREGHAVISANRPRQAVILKGPLKHPTRVALFGRGQGLTGDEIPRGEVCDREAITVAMIGEEEFALVIGAPEHVRRERLR